MDENTPKSKKSQHLLKTLLNNFVVVFLVTLLIGASFVVGSLWTQIKYLQGNVEGLRVANTGNTAPAPTQAAAAKKVAEITDADHIRGDRNAKIALVEYSDLECPYCKSFHPTAIQAIEDYPGQLMWVYRHFPLDQLHTKADKEAEASECAFEQGGDTAFWAYVDKIFEVTPSNDGLDLALLPQLAGEIGLNVELFTQCLESGKYAQKVEDQYQEGLSAGISGTPGNRLVNLETGETVDLRGAIPYAQLRAAIDDMLK